MLYGRTSRILSEAASADLLDPQVDQEVKDVVADLQDTLTTNVEEVPAGDKNDNHAVLAPEELKEMCNLWESGDGRFYCDIRDVLRICEAEGDDTDAGEVAEDIAEKNEVNSDDLVIVAPADVAEEIIENCLLEAKAGRKGKATKKAKGLGKALKQLKAKGIKIFRSEK